MTLHPPFGTFRRRPTAWAAASLVLALLSACVDFSGITPQTQLRDAGSLGLGPATATDTRPQAAPDAQWWRVLGDPQLDALVERALTSHPSLGMARARLARAEAGADAARTAMGLQKQDTIEITRQRFSENSFYPPPIGGSTRNTATLQLGFSWEFDFFGRHQQALEAALGTARAAEAEAGAARTLVAVGVVRSYLQLARLHDQLAVAQHMLEQRERSVKLVHDRVQAGLDTQAELRQSEAAVPDARQQIEALREQAALAHHALSAWVGTPNAAAIEVDPALASLHRIDVPTVVPANLLGQRADVAAARARVEAAGHDVASTRAQFYPDVNLVGFVGLASLGLGPLLEAGSLQAGVGPALHLPVLSQGSLRASLRGHTADLDAAVESYNQTVIDAVHDAADQVASVQSVARQQAEQRDAESKANDAYRIAVRRYEAGLGTYLNVLSAESAVLAQQRLGVDLNARALDQQVLLIRALGGGWTPNATAGSGGTPSATASGSDASTQRNAT